MSKKSAKKTKKKTKRNISTSRKIDQLTAENDRLRTYTDIVSRLRRTDENRGVAVCSEAADTIERLRKERDEALTEICNLKKKIDDASIIMCDWDGNFDSNMQNGNIVELAKLIEESYRILNGKSWNKENSK